jgi:hypothetical protein
LRGRQSAVHMNFTRVYEPKYQQEQAVYANLINATLC